MACTLVAPVFQQYEKELLRFVRKHLNDAGESEEIVNRVMMKMYQHCEKLPAVRNTRAWLYQITRHALYDYFKENSRRQSLPEEVKSVSSADDNLFNLLEPLLPPMIQMLPPAYAQPLQMSDLEGIPQKEIAKRLGLSLSGVKSRVQRARAKLRALFFECCYLELDRRGVPVQFAVKPHCTPLLAYQAQSEMTTSSNHSGSC